MSIKIKKIKSIKRMAVFKEFNWDSSFRDAGNNIAEFKKINIFYGRNYSGKTTLSRIFRAIETQELSSKFNNPEFSLLFDGNQVVTQNTLDNNNHAQTIRVFNEDFVKENLRFIIDDEQAINSFAILGRDNTKLEEEITRHELELGSEEKKASLYGQLNDANKAFIKAKEEHDDLSSSLEDKLRDKANKSKTGIKHNKTFGNANYNITKIKADIATVSADSYTAINQEHVDKTHGLLEEEAKATILESYPFNLNFNDFKTRTKELVERKIKASDPIKDLLSDAALQSWVETGRQYHESKRKTCAFCGSNLPKDLWEKLDKHFNKESQQLKAEVIILIQQIETEKKRIPSVINIKTSDFYSKYQTKLELLKEQFDTNSIKYCLSLDALTGQLEKRKGNIFTHLVFNEPNSVMQEFGSIQGNYEVLRKNSNHFTNSLSAEQVRARIALRLHEVYNFITDIKYSDECCAIKQLDEAQKIAYGKKENANNEVNKKRKLISSHKTQLNDESKGADRVNDLLNNFFGHQFLSLKAIKNTDEGSPAVYRFEVTRNEQKAYHLSEGESSLIAFCYFMAKLDDLETENSKPIIWIDDPVSSLDANHTFFVYSLINAKIVTPEKFTQLFISTHNLDFLKYLKRLPGARAKNSSQYFIVQRSGQESRLLLMPKYLKEYVTEFNFLFHQIYKCAKADSTNESNHHCYYNFGNNARKFLEAFLYYKYPNATDQEDKKLSRFFGNDSLASSLIGRIINEFSHLHGVFERSVQPVDVPEMKKAAEFILRKIKENDLDQYNALLQSIGEDPEELETVNSVAGINVTV